jgi:hypothetical protein
MAISACVMTGDDDRPRHSEERLRIVLTFVRSRAHAGQRMPTGVGVMHSGQIGFPHEEQETPVSREGCR